jgi:hypothetical protein
MNHEKHKIIFGRRVKVYEPENLKSPRGLHEDKKFNKPKQGVTSLLSSSETYNKKVKKPFTKGLTSKRKTQSKKLPLKWRVRRFTEKSVKELNDKTSLNKTEHQQSMETKTKKMSLRQRTQTNKVYKRNRNPFNSRLKVQPKMAISDIIEPKPVAKHQQWITSLKRNRKSSRTTHDSNIPDPYLNMSSFNISDDISHIIPSFSSKLQGRYPIKGDFSNRESVISQSNFLKNNQSISAIEPDNNSYKFINKDDPNSFLGDMAPEMDFQINLYGSSGGISSTNKTMNKNNPKQILEEKIKPRFNSSCNTLQYNQKEFTKRIMTHKKNNPSLDVHNVECLDPSGIIVPKSRHFSQPNNEIPATSGFGLHPEEFSESPMEVFNQGNNMIIFPRKSISSSNHSSFFFRK